ncbi:MAG TPA: hypothetical protein VEZ90_16135 [Blastocatellia bacterium]|nr:hypothetical protein [Blastocatellia bacterium]
MTTSRRVLVVLIVSSFWVPTFAFSSRATPARNPSQRIRSSTVPNIGIVQNTEPFDEGGCALQLPPDYAKHNRLYVFMRDYQSNAVMNINGTDVRLKLVSQQEPNGDPKVGDRSTYRFSGHQIDATVDLVVTHLCDPNDEACEVIEYDATITLTHGTSRRVIKTQGLCGS